MADLGTLVGSSLPRQKIPVFLLKTESTPSDAYREVFSTPSDDGLGFEPSFVPVLEHRFEDEGLRQVGNLLRGGQIGAAADSSYGGLVFTSQRAVDAFAKVVAEGQQADPSWPRLQNVPIYSVGPATCRALKAVPQQPPLGVFGEHAGNGANLASFILEHYADWYRHRPAKPPLLFLVGEQRRDIIPTTLMSPDLPAERRIQVDEVVVYSTGVMTSFADDFGRMLAATEDRRRRWVVVFSPTGCDHMLAALDMLDKTTGQAKMRRDGNGTSIATIGPTTRSFLLTTFGLEPDVCSEQPTPDGLKAGIAGVIHEEGD